MTAAARFANHALDTRLPTCRLPPSTAPRSMCLTASGSASPARRSRAATGLLRVAAGWGEPAVAGWGRTARLSAPAAAFLNAWQMHNQEYDCLHEGAVVHAMATILPAALAAAELRGGVSGAELIAAVAVGVDIAAGLGLASRARVSLLPARHGRRVRRRGGGRSSARPRAARAGGSLRLAARAGQRHNAGAWRGQPDPAGPGRVQRARRASILRAGDAGLRTGTLGVRGPLWLPRLFEGAFALEPVLDGLGRDWRIAEFSHKPFPAGRATHGGIEGVMALQAEHGFAAADVDRIEIIAPPLIVRLVGRPLRPDAGRELCPPVHGVRGGEGAAERLARSRGFSRRRAGRSGDASTGARVRRSDRRQFRLPTRWHRSAWSCACRSGTEHCRALRDDARQPGASPHAEPAPGEVPPLPGFCR